MSDPKSPDHYRQYQMIEVRDAGHDPDHGHATATVEVGRIPCVGEMIVMWGLPRWVIQVTHHPRWSGATETLATIWVADEMPVARAQSAAPSTP